MKVHNIWEDLLNYFLPALKAVVPYNISCGSEAVPTAEEDKFRDCLTYLDIHKFMGLCEMHLRVLKDVA